MKNMPKKRLSRIEKMEKKSCESNNGIYKRKTTRKTSECKSLSIEKAVIAKFDYGMGVKLKLDNIIYKSYDDAKEDYLRNIKEIKVGTAPDLGGDWIVTYISFFNNIPLKEITQGEYWEKLKLG